MGLPGVQEADIDISIEDEMLTIGGLREEEKETNEKNYYSKEIKRGSFVRKVRLPRMVDAAKAEASYKAGVLKVVVPIVPGTKEKVVKVNLKK